MTQFLDFKLSLDDIRNGILNILQENGITDAKEFYSFRLEDIADFSGATSHRKISGNGAINRHGTNKEWFSVQFEQIDVLKLECGLEIQSFLRELTQNASIFEFGFVLHWRVFEEWIIKKRLKQASLKQLSMMRLTGTGVPDKFQSLFESELNSRRKENQ